jgi:glycosyltransferase involved in cell wall biosynthesis
MITVLMAAKTSAEYMPNAIGSLLGQTFQDWHLVIGVNGIPDQPAVANQAWSTGERSIPNDVYEMAWLYTRPFYSRVTLMNMPDARNKGEALNRMMEHAQGEYVAILDVDDLWHPRKLELQLETARQTGADVIGTRGMYFGAARGSIGVPAGPVTLDYLRRQNGILNSSALIRREFACWEPMDEPLEDYELWLRLASTGHRLHNDSDYLTFIRCHAAQWSHGNWHIEELRKRYGG